MWDLISFNYLVWRNLQPAPTQSLLLKPFMFLVSNYTSFQLILIFIVAQDTVESVTEKIQKWVGKAAVILLDTHTPDARGGTGETFDWAVATG